MTESQRCHRAPVDEINVARRFEIIVYQAALIRAILRKVHSAYAVEWLSVRLVRIVDAQCEGGA